EGKRRSEPAVDASAKSLDRFEVYTKYRDFKMFHPAQARLVKTSGSARTRSARCSHQHPFWETTTSAITRHRSQSLRPHRYLPVSPPRNPLISGQRQSIFQERSQRGPYLRPALKWSPSLSA